MHFRVLLSVFCVLMYAGLVHASPFAYLANNGDNTVSVLDTATNTVAGWPIPVGQEPYGVAVNQRGSRVYVSNQIDKTISVIDTALLPYTGGVNPVVATIQLANIPGGLAVNAAGTRLFVALNDQAAVDVYSTLTNSKIASVTVSNIPNGIAVVQSAGAAYKVVVSNFGSQSISVIDADDDTGTYAKSADYPVTGFGPVGVAVSTNGFAYVASVDNKVSRVEIATGTETVLPAGTLNGPFGVAITPDNAKLYVTNENGSTVTVYDLLATPITGTSFPLAGAGFSPKGIAIAPNGKIYTANNAVNSVSTINTDGTLNPDVAVGTAPVSLGRFMGPLLHPIGVTAGYGGYIYPSVGSLVSLNLAGNTAYAADGKDLTLDIIPDHNFATFSLKIDDNVQSAPFPTSVTFNNVTTDTRKVEATFTRTHWDLTVTKNYYSYSEGTGTVTTSVGGINCGISDLTCGQTISIPKGTSVTLTATANTADGSEFINWGGAGCSGNTPTCVITAMNGDYIVDAHFIKKLTGPIRSNRAANYGSALATVYANAANNDIIDMLTLDSNSAAFTLPNGFDRAINITIVGGWTEWAATPYGTLPAASATTIQAPATGLAIKLGSVTIGSYNSNGAVIIK